MDPETQAIFDQLDADPRYATLYDNIDGELVAKTPAMRTTTLMEWAAHQRENDLQQEERRKEKDEFTKAKVVYQKLVSPASQGQATNRERDEFIAFLARHVFQLKGEDAEKEE